MYAANSNFMVLTLIINIKIKFSFLLHPLIRLSVIIWTIVGVSFKWYENSILALGIKVSGRSKT